MPNPGQNILASDAGSFMVSAPSNGVITLGAEADIPGATVTFTVVNASVQVLVIGSIQFRCTAFTSAGECKGYLTVDGVDQAANISASFSAANQWSQGANSWVVTLAAGSHTLKLRAAKMNGTQTVTNGYPHDVISVFVNDRA
jgi:hypothetical protein